MVSNPLVRQMSDTLSDSVADLSSYRRGSVLKKPQFKRQNSDLLGLSSSLERVSIVQQKRRHVFNKRLVPVTDNIRKRESLYKSTLSKRKFPNDHGDQQNESYWSKSDRRGTLLPEDLSLNRRRNTFITGDIRLVGTSRRKDLFNLSRPSRASKRGNGTQRQESLESVPADKLSDADLLRRRGSSLGRKPQLKRQRTFPQLVRKVSLINVLGRNGNQMVHKRLTSFQKEQLKRKAVRKIIWL